MKDKKKEAKKPELEVANEKILDLTNTLQRLQAEFENFQKRNEAQLIQNIKQSNKRLIVKLLPIADDFKRAEEHDDKDGLKHLQEKFNLILDDEGVEEIENKTFDPCQHEALMVEKSTKKEDDNKISEVFENGYSLNGEIIKHSKVKVIKYSEEN